MLTSCDSRSAKVLGILMINEWGTYSGIGVTGWLRNQTLVETVQF